MERTARALAGYGRHGDNNLLHVSDRELQGIELLTGKKFTRNPTTGLPEAFNWSSLIPVAAGIAGTAVAGPMGGALAAGATSAAKAKIEGKSTEQALTQGLISGVTSYAGGQLMTGVGEAAGQTAAQGAAQGASQGAAQTAGQGAAEAAAQGAAQGASAAAPAAAAGGPMYPDFTPGELTAVGGTPTPGPAAGVGGQLQPANAGQLDFRAIGADGKPITPFMDRVSNVYNNPEAALSQFGKNVVDKPFPALIAAGGAYSTAMDAIGPPKIPGETPYDPSRYPEQFPVNPRSWNAPGAGYSPGYSPEYRYFAAGGYVPPPPEPPKEKESGKMSDILSMGALGAIPAMMGMDRDSLTRLAPGNMIERFVGSPGGDLERERERYRTLYQAYMANQQPDAQVPGQAMPMAKGGLAALRKDDGMTANIVNEAKAALLGEHPRPADALGRFRDMFGEGALDILKDRVTGGRVRGAGGGMDDLIPGSIEGRQQVRLADGEFVVPADVVSGLGDGSTDQGVRRLHEMMRNVRQQRTGKTAQPKAIGGKITL